jgi:hypothetical protein
MSGQLIGDSRLNRQLGVIRPRGASSIIRGLL